jgi:hypothetical protein
MKLRFALWLLLIWLLISYAAAMHGNAPSIINLAIVYAAADHARQAQKRQLRPVFDCGHGK